MARSRLLSEAHTDDLLRAVLVVSRTVHHVLETRAIQVADEPLSRAKIQILRLIGQAGEQSPSQIAPYLGVSKPAVTQLVTSMVEAKLTERIADGRDRRGFKLKLTARGRRVLKKIRGEQHHLVLAAFTRSTGKHRKIWAEALREVATALVQADKNFRTFCHRCGAHEDGSCVLVGGNADCLHQRAVRQVLRKKKTARRRRRTAEK